MATALHGCGLTCLVQDKPAHWHLPKDPVQGGSLDAHLSTSTLNLRTRLRHMVRLQDHVSGPAPSHGDP